MQRPDDTPPSPLSRRLPVIAWFSVIGPGVLGLASDNDAGGILSYLLTGAAHRLNWFIPAMMLMAPMTYLIQELALRVAIATRMPYGKLLSLKFGRTVARINGVVLHGLNGVILVTEFVGMTSALSLIGVPWTIGLVVSLALVLTVTSWRRYENLERLLLGIALINLVFFPIVFLVHPTPQAWHQAFRGTWSPRLGFLLLSLAGNAIAPWMIYWQQNAVWAGNVKTLAAGRKDVWIGVCSQVLMATSVLFIGALTGTGTVSYHHPLTWLSHQGGPLVGDLFAVGLFNAGFLAACTISLSSAWMIREVWYVDLQRREQTPTQGSLKAIHILTVTLAALVVVWPSLSAGAVALWAQALGALWMPVSLFLLVILAADAKFMGPMAIRVKRKIIFSAIILFFIVLAILSLTSR